MARAGFNVPDGFLVTTDGYRAYVADHGLQTQVRAGATTTLMDGSDQR
jgi:phosphoenolpyruvate synthase/pyruvate phosphate dikinase